MVIYLDLRAPHGGTNVASGILKCDGILQAYRPGRSMIFLVSDGLHNSGVDAQILEQETVRVKNECNSRVVCVGIGPSVERNQLLNLAYDIHHCTAHYMYLRLPITL